MVRFVRSCLAVCILVVAATAPSAHATYGGENGVITFDLYRQDNTPDIHAIDPDGSNQRLLIENGRFSAWSPDGRRVAYTCPTGTCTAAANGTDIEPLDDHGLLPQFRPFWSPDGKRLIVDNRLTFGHNPESEYSELWRIDSADGGGPVRMATFALSGSWSHDGRIAYTEQSYEFDHWVATMDDRLPNSGSRLTTSGTGSWPDWSPDGTKIVFEGCQDPDCGIYVMNRDGTDQTLLTFGADPVWSPDGTKILFQRFTTTGTDLWVMNANGTGIANLTNTPDIYEQDPAWQPLTGLGYPRPKSAPRVRVSFVPAFEACTGPNRVHGPPLDSPSCAPPTQRARFMTFGAAPAGNAPKAQGQAHIAVRTGATPEDSDVQISARLTDVRRASDLADAPDAVALQVPVRITDRYNGPSHDMRATVQDVTMVAWMPCLPTSDTTVGATCSVNTTAEALVPYNGGLSVHGGKRAVWQFGQITAWDGGDDGYVESTDDNSVLAVQGVFVP
jgi:hypothetical protein